MPRHSAEHEDLTEVNVFRLFYAEESPRLSLNAAVVGARVWLTRPS